MSIKDWPVMERPREKLLKHGAGALSDAEILAIFLRTGTKGQSAIEISRNLLTASGGLRGLLSLPLSEMSNFKGIGAAKYVQFQAALELGKRYLNEHLERHQFINSPQASRDYLTLCLRDKPYEAFYALFLDSKHRVIHHQELFRGTIDSATVPIREVVKEVLKHNAAAMVVAHNHPSGVAEPSVADQLLTERLNQALNLVGVRLLDHFVVGDGEVVSFAELGALN